MRTFLLIVDTIETKRTFVSPKPAKAAEKAVMSVIKMMFDEYDGRWVKFSLREQGTSVEHIYHGRAERVEGWRFGNMRPRIKKIGMNKFRLSPKGRMMGKNKWKI